MNAVLLYQECPPYTLWGCISIYAQTVAQQLFRLGNHLSVISMSASAAPRFEVREGVRIHRVGVEIWRRYSCGRTVDRLVRSREIARFIGKIGREQPIDFIESGEADFGMLSGRRMLAVMILLSLALPRSIWRRNQRGLLTKVDGNQSIYLGLVLIAAFVATPVLRVVTVPYMFGPAFLAFLNHEKRSNLRFLQFPEQLGFDRSGNISVKGPTG